MDNLPPSLRSVVQPGTPPLRSEAPANEPDTGHDCPFTTAQLLALLAILTVRGRPTRLLDHIRTHHAQHQAHDDQHHTEQHRCDISPNNMPPNVTP